MEWGTGVREREGKEVMRVGKGWVQVLLSQWCALARYPVAIIP